MNVTAVFRLTDQRVFTFLEVAARNGFPQAPHLAMYFVRGWRLDALKKGDAKDEFLTGNQYDCICMNAEEFILLRRWLVGAAASLSWPLTTLFSSVKPVGPHFLLSPAFLAEPPSTSPVSPYNITPTRFKKGKRTGEVRTPSKLLSRHAIV